MSDTEKSAQAQPNESAEPSFRYNAKLAQGIEEKWQKIWDDKGTFWAANVNGDLKDGKGRNADGRPAYFAMDMFPYPSGKGLHVGHPLGYLASDVVSRYHRMKGENVLHAMGYDAFGLPAEQYAVQTGQHPRITTEQNIANMRRQLHRMGLSFDNRRSFATIDPGIKIATSGYLRCILCPSGNSQPAAFGSSATTMSSFSHALMLPYVSTSSFEYMMYDRTVASSYPSCSIFNRER